MRETNVALNKASPEESPFSKFDFPFTDAEEESHIIGPTSSLDILLIVEYLSIIAPGNAAPLWFTKSFQDHLMAEQRLVTVYRAVHRRPLGTSPSQTIDSSKCKIIEKMLDPFCEDLVNLYFERINPCFPILDGVTQLAVGQETSSPTLRACLLAHTMVFWKQLRKRAGEHCPDIRFVWNQANEALYSELYLSPGMQTLSAILLNIAGRPLTSMIGNGILLGSAISLAQSLGLHYDCRNEDIRLVEKLGRTRVWWIIVVLDKWSSVAYGKPPQLRRTQSNVRRPDSGDYARVGGNRKTSIAFPALVTLTEVLDTYLEYVFNLRRNRGTRDSPQVIEKPDLAPKLRAWEDSLPGPLRSEMLQGNELRAPNLRLAYLYIKFVGLKEKIIGIEWNADDTATDITSLDFNQPALRAAEAIVRFIQSLDERDLSDFWLSPIAFTLSDTVSYLVGCAIREQRSDPPVRFTSSLAFQLARDMISALQSHQTRYGWDIGAVCLAQHAKIVEQLLAPDASAASDMPDLEGGADGFIIPNRDVATLPDLWEWFEGI
ncbi:MAG: hypothetical protein OHK93_004482 [Ramalina farinacea]|uniref:Xylanolytic transcriptional activator regulatory domain-containing protein n=1 Tax=Ramalina farinacea TaxID=258253 RepID=A0AA43QU97_9LECA|nr:hypothetical protein [Ramalina farinacea]